MFLRKIKLSNFKNHPNGEYVFTKKFTAFVGPNGAGKTNLLDLVYFLCMTKSFTNLTDQQLILKNQDYLRIEAELENEGAEFFLLVKIAANRKKEFLFNEQPYTKIAEHIGKIPVVLISPEDAELIHGTSEIRRKLIDTVLSQLDKGYLEALIQYNKVLEQRNSLLRLKAENPGIDLSALDFYNSLLIRHGQYIHEKRMHLFAELEPIFIKYYHILCNGAENIYIEYVTQLKSESWSELLAKRLSKDLMLQRTTGGIHRDDIEFYISGERVKKFGSQGQQKSFLISLKLSLAEFISKEKAVRPILLIDDIFDKLDSERSSKLFEILSYDTFGQVFITDTNPQRINESFQNNSSYLKIYYIEKKFA